MKPYTTPMSQRQADMLAFIVKYRAEYDYSPSHREIQAGCDISSVSVVEYNVGKLEQKGWIRTTPGMARSIVPVALNPLEEIDIPVSHYPQPKIGNGFLTPVEKLVAQSYGSKVLRHIDGRPGKIFFQPDAEGVDRKRL